MYAIKQSFWDRKGNSWTSYSDTALRLSEGLKKPLTGLTDGSVLTLLPGKFLLEWLVTLT